MHVIGVFLKSQLRIHRHLGLKNPPWVVHTHEQLNSCVFAVCDGTQWFNAIRYLVIFSVLNVNKHEEHYDRHPALTKCLWAIRFAYITVKATHIFKLCQPKSREKIYVKTQQHCFCCFLYTVILMNIVIPHKLFTIPRKKKR